MELVLLLEAMKDLHLTAVSIQLWTRKDTIHSSVNKYIQDGRPQNCSEEFRVFYNFKLELSTLSGCILCDCRVVITLTTLEWSVKPWTRLNIDYASPFMSTILFIIVNARYKWVEMFGTPSTSAIVIQCLRRTFTRFELPQTIVSDNVSNLMSMEILRLNVSHMLLQHNV